MTAALYLCAVVIAGTVWLWCSIRMIYRAGYKQGQIDQTREDSQKFLQAMERRGGGKT